MGINEIQQIVDKYLELFPAETVKLRSLQKRLDVDELFNNRKSFTGHGTAGAIVLSPDRKKVLLVHHRFLDKWIQPGGHWDPEEPDPWTAARREAEEETGVSIGKLLAPVPGCPHVPIDIDSHDIPANESKNEPAHIHHDFRYVYIADNEQLRSEETEIHAVAWVPIRSNDKRLVEVMPSIRKLQDLQLI